MNRAAAQFYVEQYEKVVEDASKGARVCLSVAKPAALLPTAQPPRTSAGSRAAQPPTAIELQEDYVKAWSRRGQANEKLERYQEALDDFTQVLVLSPCDKTAEQACRRLPPLAEKQREKLKEEVSPIAWSPSLR